MADETIRVKLEAIGDFSDITKNVNTLQKSFTKLKMPDKLSEGFKKNFSEIDNTVEQIQKKLVDGIKTPGDVAQLEKLFNRLSASAGQISDRFSKGLAKGSIKLNIDGDEEVAKIENQLDDLRNRKIDIGINDEKVQAATKAFLELANHSDAAKKYINQFNQALASGDPTQIETAEKALHKYATSVDNLKKRTGDERILSQGFRDIIDASGDAQSQIEELTQKVEKLEQELEEVRKVKLDPDANGLSEMGSDLNRATTEMRQFGDAVTEAQRRQQDAASDIENLRNQIKNYFGLDEIFRKIGDAVRDAFETIKELDKAMTETAVVTSFDVGDMWKKLPEYTKEANALGSSISDVYNATTLYYQQGLNTAQSMGLANETLKMARIAGMDAADATDAMTAALRGFNMEVNQTSAQKINDVYSKLAADTAADTQEISTAMEKTASIANSAGMEFGTTSAFLSQMIETTREAPENLGTAMKTVIARFQELKQNPLTIVDSEGEFLDRNKVDTALKSIGVSLTDAQGEFRNLDDVFLEISSKWDTLTKSQQRYIATTAAGSRQQSRFIAMMQNYDRTMELVEAANNSAGASDEQFSKTLESIDSKLNRLNNAWQEFTMGIANDTFVKFAVDGFTTILGLITNIIDGISQIGVIDPFKGLIKSGLSIITMFKAMSIGSRLLLTGVDKVADNVIASKTGKGGLFSSLLGKVKGPTIGSQVQTTEQYNAGYKEGEARVKGFEAAIQKQKYDPQAYTSVVPQEEEKTADLRQKQYQENVAKRRASGQNWAAARLGAIKDLKNDIAVEQQITPLVEQYKEKVAKDNFDAIHKTLLKNNGLGVSDEVDAAMAEAYAKENAGADLFADIEKEARQQSTEIGEEAGENLGEALKNTASTEAKQGLLKQALGDDYLPTTPDIPDQTNKFQSMSAGLTGLSNSATSAGQSMQQLGMALAATPFAPVGQAVSLLGIALTGVGGLLNSVAGLASKAGLIWQGGMEAAAISTVGLTDAEWAAAAASAGLSAEELQAAVAGNMMAEGEVAAAAGAQTLGAALWSALWPILAIAAAIAALVVIVKGVDAAFETQNEKMERLGKAADEAGAAVDTTKNALESLNNDLDALKTNEDAFEGLVKGTAEWNSALADNNAQITDLLSKYDTLNEINPETGEYQYIRTDEDGRMTITEEGKARLKAEKTEAKNRAQAVNQIAQARAKAQKAIMSEEYKAIQAETYNTGKDAESIEKQRRAQAQKNAIDAQNVALQESAIKSSVTTITKDLGLKNEKAITESLTKGYDKLAEKQVLGSKEQNMQEYADYMGYTYKDKKLYSGEDEVEIDDEALRENLKDLKALDSLQNYADELDQTISRQNASFADILKENKVSGKTTETLLGDILSANEETDTDALRKAIDSSAIDKWATQQKQKDYADVSDAEKRSLELQLGWSEGSIDSVQEYQSAIDELSQTLKTNAQNLLELDTEHVQAASGALSGAGYSDKAIQGLLEKMGSAQYTALGKNAENIADNIGQKYATQYSKTVGKLYSGNAESRAAGKELQSMFSGVDMSNATDALLAYRTAADSANKSISKLGKQVVNGYKGAEMAATGLQDAYTSLSSEQLKKLQEASASQGGITSTTVQELGVFQNYLDATGMSAGSLANVLNDLTNGSISFDNLTAGVVAFYSELGKANDAVNAASNYGKDFQARDTSTTASFLKDAQTSRGVKREDYYRQIFGTDNYDKLLAKNNYNFKKTNNSLADNIDKFMSDNKINVNAVKALAKKKKYDIDAMVKAMQEQYSFTEETARAIIGGAQGQSDSLRTKFTRKENKKAVKAYEKSGQDYAQEMGASIKSLYNYDDMKAIAGKVVGNTEKNKFWETMAEQAKVSPDVIANLKKEYKGKPAKEYRHALAQYIKDSTNVLLQNGDFTQLDKAYKTNKKGQYVDQNGQVIDGEGITKMFSSVAKNQEDADKQTLEYFKKNYKDIEYAGQHFEASDLKNVDTMRAAMERMTDNSQWVTVGKTIGAQIVEAWQHRNDKPTEPTGGDNSNDSSQPTGGGGSSKEDENPTVEVDTTDLDEKIAKKQEEIKRLKSQDRLTTAEETQRDAKVAELERELKTLKAYKTAEEKEHKPTTKPTKSDATTSGETAGQTRGYNKGVKEGYELSENEQKLKDIGTDIGSKIVSALKGEGLKKDLDPSTFKKKENWSVTDAGKSGAKVTDLTYDAEKARKTIESIDSPIDDWFTGIGDKIKGIFNTGDGEGGIFSGLKSGIDAVKGALKGLPGFNNEPDTTIKVKLNVVGIEPDPVTVPAKLNITGQIEPGGSFLSKILGNSEEGYTVPVKGNLKSEDITVPKEGVTVPVKADKTLDTSGIDTKKATIEIQTPGAGKLKAVRRNYDALQDKTVTVTVITNETGGVDTKSISSGMQSAANAGASSISSSLASAAAAGSGALKSRLVNAMTTAAAQGGAAIKSRLSNISASVSVTPKLTRQTIAVSKKSSVTVGIGFAAAGVNNTGYGSLARGTGSGRLGPKGRGGLTLTGEEGYEIAWLPRESRSMVVGANGPQMVDLPSDAVVWNHKQSEKILKKNSGMTLASLAKGTINAGSAAKKNKKYGFKTTKSKEIKAMDLVGAIEVASEAIEILGNAADRVSDKLDKAFEQPGKKFSDLASQINKLTNYYKTQFNTAKKQESQAQKLLKLADKSQKRASVSAATKATGDKKEKNVWYAEGDIVKKQNGRLVANISKIKKIAKNNSKTAYQYNELYNQLLDAATSYAGEFNDKLDSAVDAKNEAEQALADLREQIKETYFSWENELQKIQILSSKIELVGSYKSAVESMVSLVEARTLAGFENVSGAAQEYQKLTQRILGYTTQNVRLNADMVAARRVDMRDIRSGQAMSNELKIAQANFTKSPTELNRARRDAAEDAIAGFKAAQPYLSGEGLDTTFDFAKFQADKDAGKINEKTYELIKDYWEQLMSAMEDYQAAIGELQNTMADVYNTLSDQYDYADQQTQTLIEGYSAAAEEEIETLNNLNESLTNAMGDLLDGVQKALEKQRQAEENRKTEEDISNKMNRLSILRADTSGGHAVEIAELEKEIQEMTGNYEDTLEDQMLEELRDQADQASKQREKQIELLQHQLDYTKSTGLYLQKAVALVEAIMNTPDGQAIDPALLEEYTRVYKAGSSDADLLTPWRDKRLEGEVTNSVAKLRNFNTTVDNLVNALKDLERQISVTNAMSGTSQDQQDLIASAGNNKEELNQTLSSMREQGLSVDEAAGGLKQIDSLKDNKTAQVQTLSKAGYSNADLITSDEYSTADVQSALGLTPKQLEAAGVDAQYAWDTGAFKGDVANFSKVYDGSTIAMSNGTKGSLRENGYIYSYNGKGTMTYQELGSQTISQKTAKDVTKADLTGPYKSNYKKLIQYSFLNATTETLLNKNWNTIRKLAGLRNGKYYTLKRYGLKALINDDGIVHMANAKKTGVTRWNPAKGTKETVKYKKADDKKWIKWAKDKEVGKQYTKVLLTAGKHSKASLKKKGVQFATGGLADYTGPAWLDGTPSKPELVLNAQDTKNFLALKDILSDTMRGASTINNTSGTYQFDIDINVDEIANDYDVKQIASTIEKEIVRKARYRNVNAVSFKR